MTERAGQEEYQLVYEGEVDDRLETLQRIKGVFIADLELSIPQVKEILDKKPVPIKSAPRQADLEYHYQALKKAGARVLIVQPASANAEPQSETGTLATEAARSDAFDFFSDYEPTNFRELHASDLAKPITEEDPLDIMLELDAHPKAAPQRDAAAKHPIAQAAPVEKAPSIQKADEGSAPLFQFDDAAPAKAPAPPKDANDAPIFAGLAAPAPAPAEAKSAAELSKEISDLLRDEPLMLAETPEPEETPALITHTPAGKTVESQLLAEEELAYDDGPAAATPTAALQASPSQAAPAPSAAPSSLLSLKGKAPAPQVEGPAAGDAVANTARRRTRTLPWDIIAPILIGSSVLIGGNWLYFAQQQAKVAALKQGASTTTKTHSKPADKPEAPKLATVTLSGKSQVAGLETTAELNLLGGRPAAFQITAITPPPPELTPEEIVTKKMPPPWISKVVIEAADLKSDESGSFNLTVPARVYIEQNGQRNRLLVDSTTHGSYSEQKKEAQLDFDIQSDFASIPKDQTYGIQTMEQGGYRLFVKGSVILK